MNIIIEKGLLLTPLARLVSITERRSIMPILSNILISFSKGKIDIYSTDLELSAISHVDHEWDGKERSWYTGEDLWRFSGKWIPRQ